ncbi:unnamed protein product [Coffea canephora]|uniref:Uncharacterized protein n=1 Tax=Coffea canephora TaxID=49390 RepID=A0A068U8B9_COFCA|nr:unnamed protein product [Coffea canephora]
MDIDLLWAVGGWLLIPDCMATLKTSSKISESSSKSQNPFLLFLGLIFIFLVLVHSSDPSISPSLESTQTLVPHSSPSSASSPSPPSSAMKLHSRRSKTMHTPSSSSSSASREFEAGEHEVPSGPNPISN